MSLCPSLSGEGERKKNKNSSVSRFSQSTSTEGPRYLVLLGYSSTRTSLVQCARHSSQKNRLRCPAQSSLALRHQDCREGRASSRMTPASCAVLYVRIAGTAGLASDTLRGRRLRSPRICSQNRRTLIVDPNINLYTKQSCL